MSYVNEVYNGIYSAQQLTPSLRKSRYTGASIPIYFLNPLYLAIMQAEKEDLIRKWYGREQLTYELVVLIQAKVIKNAYTTGYHTLLP